MHMKFYIIKITCILFATQMSGIAWTANILRAIAASSAVTAFADTAFFNTKAAA